MSLADGLQHLGYAARVSLANSVSRQPVAPELVYDAPCFVAEPVPLTRHTAYNKHDVGVCCM